MSAIQQAEIEELELLAGALGARSMAWERSDDETARLLDAAAEAVFAAAHRAEDIALQVAKEARR